MINDDIKDVADRIAQRLVAERPHLRSRRSEMVDAVLPLLVDGIEESALARAVFDLGGARDFTPPLVRHRALGAQNRISRDGELVYAIGSPDSPLVKIGYAIDVPHRLWEIQLMCPVPLAVRWTHSGDRLLEGELHRRFKRRRSHGEWFDLGPDPVALLNSVFADEGNVKNVQVEEPVIDWWAAPIPERLFIIDYEQYRAYCAWEAYQKGSPDPMPFREYAWYWPGVEEPGWRHPRVVGTAPPWAKQ